MLKRWKQLFVTVPFEFEVVPAGEERYWRAGIIRESAVQKVIRLGFTKGRESRSGATKPQKVTETPCCTSCQKNQPATAHSSCTDAAAVKTAAPNTTDSPKPEGKTCVGQSLGR